MSSAQDVFQTTFDFVLPRGYVDADGRVGRRGPAVEPRALPAADARDRALRARGDREPWVGLELV